MLRVQVAHARHQPRVLLSTGTQRVRCSAVILTRGDWQTSACVALFVESCAVAAPGRSVLTRRNAWGDTLLFTGGNEPIRIIAAIGDQMFGIGKTGQQASRTGVIAGVPGC